MLNKFRLYKSQLRFLPLLFGVNGRTRTLIHILRSSNVSLFHEYLHLIRSKSADLARFAAQAIVEPVKVHFLLRLILNIE